MKLNCNKSKQYLIIIIFVLYIPLLKISLFADDTIVYNFIFPSKISNVNKIEIAGDFNNRQKIPLKKENNNWVTTINIKPGKYKYKLLIDNEIWIFDEYSEEIVNDGFSGFYSILYITDDISYDTSNGIIFTYKSDDAFSVSLVGSFNKWNLGAHPMKKDKNGIWKIQIKLDKGSYYYKFVIDGKNWRADKKNPNKSPDGFGGYNSVIDIR